MAFFKRDYNKPGPGVPKNAPRKKGVPRFFEILGRDGGNIIKLNILTFLCMLPSFLLFALGLVAFAAQDGFWMLIFLVLSLAAGVLVGPARTTEAFIITKMLRDDPGFVWHDFKSKFKENFKSTAVSGIIYSLIIYMQVLTIVLVLQSGQKVNAVWIGLYLLSVLIVAMAAPYYFVQAAYLEMKPIGLLKNSLFLALGHLPRSFMGGIISLLFAVLQILAIYLAYPLLPLIFIFSLFIGISFPTLITMMWDWPPVDKIFKIEKTLKEREQNSSEQTDDNTKETTTMTDKDKEALKEEKKEQREEKHEEREKKHQDHIQNIEKEMKEIEDDGVGLSMVEAEDPTL